MRDETGKLPTLDSHVDNEYGTKTMVYNRKKNKKRRRRKKKQKKKERLKKHNSKKKERTLNY